MIANSNNKASSPFEKSHLRKGLGRSILLLQDLFLDQAPSSLGSIGERDLACRDGA